MNSKRLTLSLLLFLFQLMANAQKYDAILINQKTTIELKKGKRIQTCSYEIQINNRKGDESGEISIPFSKMEPVSDIKAYIKDQHGVLVRNLKKSEIVTKSSISSFSLYEDDFVAEFTLKHNVYPYTIVYSYQTSAKEFLALAYWFPTLGSKIPTKSATLTITLPKEESISYSNQKVSAPEVETIEDQKIYTWKTSYLDPIKPELWSPSLRYSIPSVIVVPLHFKFDKEGSYESWKTYGDWQFSLLEGLSELPETEKFKITSLITGVTDEKEKIKILYHYLQDETRYINVTIETGGMKPYPADYVSLNKYGDCKALANYLQSILAFAGIKSYYTTIKAGDQINPIDKKYPSQQFNHVIVVVPLKTDTLWLDATSDFAFNYVGTFIQNREAFITSENNSHFVHTPALIPETSHETRVINISYDHQHNSKAHFTKIVRGNMYEQIFSLNAGVNEADKTRILRNHYLEDGFELIDYQIAKKDRDSLNIQISYNAYGINIYRNYGNDMILSNVPWKIPAFEKPETRKLPIQIDYPISKTDTITYEIAPNYKLTQIPTDVSLLSPFGSYQIHFKSDNQKIQVIKSLLIHSGNYPLESYPEFYQLMHQIDEWERSALLVLTK